MAKQFFIYFRCSSEGKELLSKKNGEDLDRELLFAEKILKDLSKTAERQGKVVLSKKMEISSANVNKARVLINNGFGKRKIRRRSE